MTAAAPALACSGFSPASSNMRWTCATYFWRSSTSLGIFLQVVLPIGQAETTLVELRDHRIGVFEILTRAEFKQRSHADGLQVRDLTGDLGLVGELADAVEFRLEWGEASGVDGLFVHAGGIEVADLLGGGIAAGGGLGGRFQNLVEDVAVAIRQFIEAAPHGLVGRNGVVLHPGTAGILIEIDAGVHRFVDGGEIKLRGAAGVTGGRLRGQDAECKRGSNCDLQ